MAAVDLFLYRGEQHLGDVRLRDPSAALLEGAESIVATVEFTVPTGAVGTTFDITAGSSFGWKVKAVLGQLCGASTADLSTGVGRLSAFGTDLNNVRCFATAARNSAGNTQSPVLPTVQHLIAILNPDGTSAGQAALVGPIEGGIRARVTTVFADAFRGTALIIGGDAPQALCGDHATVPTGSNRVVSMPCLMDLFVAWGDRTWNDTVQSGVPGFSFGFSCRAQGASAGANWGSRDNVSQSECFEVVDGFHGMRGTAANAEDSANFVNAWDASSLTLREFFGNNVGPSQAFLALSLPNVRLWTGTIDSRTANGPQAYTDPGWRVGAIAVASTLVDTLSTTKTNTQATSIGLGFAADWGGTIVEGAGGIRQRDNIFGSAVASSVGGSWALEIEADTGGVGLAASASTFDATGYTLLYAAVQGTARKQVVLAIERFEITLSPDPAIANATGADPVVESELVPSPAVAQATGAAPLITLTMLPDSAIAQATGAAPQLTLELLLGSAIAQATGVAVALAADFRPTPAIAQATGAGPTVSSELSLGSAIAQATGAGPLVASELRPGSAVAQATGAAPQLTLVVLPGSAIAEAIAPVISTGGDIELTPSPAVAQATAGGPAVSRELALGSAVAQATGAAPQLLLDLVPSPAVALAVAPVIAQGSIVDPDPAIAEATAPPLVLTLDLHLGVASCVSRAPSIVFGRKIGTLVVTPAAEIARRAQFPGTIATRLELPREEDGGISTGLSLPGRI